VIAPTDEPAAEIVAAESPVLSAAYLHVQRAVDLLRAHAPPPPYSDDPIHRGHYFATFAGSLCEWITRNRVPSLTATLLAKKLAPGTLVTHYGPLYVRGLANRKSPAAPLAHARVPDASGEHVNVEMVLSPEYLTSSSSRAHLSGRNRFFVLAIVGGVSKKVVSLRPILLGILGPKAFSPGVPLPMLSWNTYGEIFPREVDAFSRLDTVRAPTIHQLERLRYLPEREVKDHFAKVIGETFVPLDWGGEASDLFSSRITVGGKSVTAAFIFKGPARFHPMRVVDLGKNGDQAIRAFNEPAHLIVLQHCHRVESAVREHLRALANQVGRSKRFVVIDGADTYRILRAYDCLDAAFWRSRTRRKM
jgi:hypothetical protein